MRIIELALSDIPVDRPLRVEADETGVVVIRSDAGVHAFEDSCPHAKWRLSEGDVIGNVLECPGHGWEFNTTTGRCLNVPAYCLKPFTVTADGDRITIEVEAPADQQKETCPGQTSV